MCVKVLNSIGLILSIIGSVFWFVWGTARTRESFGLALEENTPIETKWGRITVKEASAKSELSRCVWLAKFGMLLIGIGFVFQLIATWL